MRYAISLTAAAASCVLALIPSLASAQTVTIAETLAKTNLFSFDYGIPASPALTLAGLSQDKTPTSTSLKAFVIQGLPTVFEGKANGQSAALDVAPAATLNMSYLEYINSERLDRILTRTRVGVAVYRGVEDSDPAKVKGAKLAVGFSTSLLDDSDPIFASDGDGNEKFWVRCTTAAINAADAGLVAPGTNRSKADAKQIEIAAAQSDLLSLQGAAAESKRAEVERLQNEFAGLDAKAANDLKAASASFGAAVKGCSEKAANWARVGQDLDIGAGVLWNGDPRGYDDFGKGSGALWAAYKRPFPIKGSVRLSADGTPEQAWLVGGVARYAWRESVSTGDKTTPNFLADTVDAWVGLERVDAKSRLAFQYGWFDADARDKALDRFSHSGDRWLLTGSRLLDESLGAWLNVSYGVADGTTETRNDKKVLVTITFAPPEIPNIFR